MILYKDILDKLCAAGYSSYRIRREKILPNSVVDRLRNGEPITTTTLDTICRLLNCQPGDIIEYRDDKR